jgi:serine/threonine protein kinase
VTATTARAEPDVVPVGAEVLPGYRVEELLARGGRVDTYDVTSLERDCRAVVKVLRADRLDDAHVRQAVATEGMLLTTLSHPHLVRGYEVVTAPRPGLVLETLPGATLAALLDDGRLGVADTALLGRQLVSVLGYLHRQGWVHLDVKPENVVVQEGRAVLIDLGLASRPGRLVRGMGTDGYAAPEQDAGGTISPATDVWGLGATLAECVTGVPPGRTPDLSRVPDPLRPVLSACLRDDPSDRPSLAELRERLDALLAAPEPSWWDRLSTARWSRTWRLRRGR